MILALKIIGGIAAWVLVMWLWSKFDNKRKGGWK